MKRPSLPGRKNYADGAIVIRNELACNLNTASAGSPDCVMRPSGRALGKEAHVASSGQHLDRVGVVRVTGVGLQLERGSDHLGAAFDLDGTGRADRFNYLPLTERSASDDNATRNYNGGGRLLAEDSHRPHRSALMALASALTLSAVLIARFGTPGAGGTVLAAGGCAIGAIWCLSKIGALR